jgi:hypothetical protein
MLLVMSKHRRSIRLFRWSRREDDLLARSLRRCTGCAEHVHVFAEACRHCGQALELGLAAT